MCACEPKMSLGSKVHQVCFVVFFRKKWRGRSADLKSNGRRCCRAGRRMNPPHPPRLSGPPLQFVARKPSGNLSVQLRVSRPSLVVGSNIENTATAERERSTSARLRPWGFYDLPLRREPDTRLEPVSRPPPARPHSPFACCSPLPKRFKNRVVSAAVLFLRTPLAS